MAASDVIGDFKMDLTDILGHGSYGVVFKGNNIITGQPVAVKRLKITNTEFQKKYLEREISALEAIAIHPNIVQMLHHQEHGGFYCIVLEFCDCGTIDEFLIKTEVEMSQMVRFMEETVSAVEFLHSLSPPMIHRDLKSANIFVKSTSGQPVSKVADFGTAKAELGDCSTVIGTRCFMAPEVCSGLETGEAKYDKAADVFAMGLILHAMLERKPNEELKVISSKYNEATISNRKMLDSTNMFI